jgi:hypothetical protein
VSRWPRFVHDWGSTELERAEGFPCDRLIAEPDQTLYRAIDTRARPETVFRWLCQLRVAPYSYDLLDNGGRRSPQTLTPGLERLEVGQPVMRIFKLVEFEQGSSITVLSKGRLFGRVAVSYRIVEGAQGGSRLLAKLLVKHARRGLAGRLEGILLAPGDLVMMRRQLLNLGRLSDEQDASSPERVVGLHSG